MRITAFTCVKNEGPFLLEWIAFNRMIGVTGQLFYSNDCTDGTDTLLDVLAGHGIVQHLPNPAKSRKYQVEALRDARRQPIVTGADWLWNADVDEFLNIHVGDGTIPELIEACGGPDAISITHQHFASTPVTDFADAPVIGQFTRSHNPDIWCDHLAIEVKTLMRADLPSDYWGAHRPFVKGFDKDTLPNWTDGSGRQVSRTFILNDADKRLFGYTARGARDFATLNHYALRSLDSYLVKIDRGDVNRENRAFDDTYWRERNDTAYEDTSIQRHLPKLQQGIAALKSLPGVAEAHDDCVASHRATIDRLLAQDDYAATRAQLLAASALPPAEDAMIAMLQAARA